MTGVLLVVMAWRLVRPLAAPAIVIGLGMLLLHGGSSPRHDGRHTLEAVGQVVQPIEHDLQHALGRTLRP
jgi:hypothetical protein